jgi:Ca2+-binding EF-hand superfamily protein
MGCGAPSIEIKAKEFNLDSTQSTELVLIMKFLGFNWHEVDRIHASFSMMDLDQTRSIHCDEMIETLHLTNSQFTKDAFRVFDRDQDGGLDFIEFLIASTKLCCADHENLCRFAFRMIDQDASGEIDKIQLHNIVNNMYGENVAQLKPGKFHSNGGGHHHHHGPEKQSIDVILDKLDTNHSGTLAIQDFIRASREFPQLIKPAFQLQMILRDKVVNSYFWESREEKIRKKFAEVVKQKTKQENTMSRYVEKFSDPQIIDTKHGSIRKIHPTTRILR